MGAHMSTIDYTEFLHNVKQEFIKSSFVNDDDFILEIEMPVKVHVCPKCGCKTKQIKDYHVRTVRFGKVQGKSVIGKYRARRYQCGYCKASFSEKNPFVRRYMQVSITNLQHLFSRLKESLNYTAIAKECDTSITTVIRYFDSLSIPKPKELPMALGIDEFRGNAGSEPFQVNVTDLEHLEIIDILPSRNTQALISYFRTFSRKVRANVKFIVMDMCSQFKKVMKALFPHAHIICDRYHVCRLVDWAVERVRKREQQKLASHSRMLKQNKRVLIKHPERLTDAEAIKLEEIFKVSDDLRKAYALKLAFRKLFVTYGKTQIANHINNWLTAVANAHLPEFKNFFTSFPQWSNELVNAFLLPYSNGYTEGTHNKIKVLKRISYGLRNFKRFRVRILLLSKKNETNHRRDWFHQRLVG